LFGVLRRFVESVAEPVLEVELLILPTLAPDKLVISDCFDASPKNVKYRRGHMVKGVVRNVSG
jgi:hypothetical protein